MAVESSSSKGPDSDSGEDMTEMMFAKRGCCFWMPCLRSRSNQANKTAGSPSWERIRTAEHEEKWWSKGWKAVLKVREWSEIIAGPKWKTFIRRFNKNNRGGCGGCNGGGGGFGNGGGKLGKFQYDPLGYSLNFDKGPGQNGLDHDDYVFRDFSSRYAAIPISAKSSMDLGKDGPSFI